MIDDDRLPADLFIAATIRRAASEGVSIMVIRKGASASGGILLKINLCNGLSFLLSQTRFGDDLVWTPFGGDEPLSETEIDALIAFEADNDPDLWVVEVEDKKGRHWFDGKIVDFKNAEVFL